MDWNWIIAVVLAAAASFISNFGVTLQKLQHQRIAAAIARANNASMQHDNNSTNNHNGALELARGDSDLSDDLDDARQQHAIPINNGNNHSDDSTATDQAPSTAWHRKPLWRLGLALIVLGSIADFLALGFGPQSLIAPLGSLTLVSNAVYAPLILKEKISKWDWMSIGLIVFGSSLAVVFGAHTDNFYTIDQLFSFFFRADFVAYWIVVALYIGIYRYYIFKIEQREDTFGRESTAYAKVQPYHRFGYPSISGAIGAQSVLFAKCFMELIVNTIQNKSNMFIYPSSYLVIAGMCVSIFLQIKWLNEGLRRFDSSFCVPVFQAFWIILSVISGMIFYEEYMAFTGNQAIMFVVGVFITIGGVATLRGAKNLHSHIGDEETLHDPTGDLLDAYEQSPFFINNQPRASIDQTHLSSSRSSPPSAPAKHNYTPESDDDEIVENRRLNTAQHSDEVELAPMRSGVRRTGSVKAKSIVSKVNGYSELHNADTGEEEVRINGGINNTSGRARSGSIMSARRIPTSPLSTFERPASTSNRTNSPHRKGHSIDAQQHTRTASNETLPQRSLYSAS